MVSPLYAYHNDGRGPAGRAPGRARPQPAPDADRALALAVLTLGYLAPWAIATRRGRGDTGNIGLVNALTGWTVIGWVVALAMALGGDG